jgi:hypothetical protein
VILFLNGAFGIGKTAVARELVARLPHSSQFDPELIGMALQRLTRLSGRDVEDFQDMASWRRLSIAGLRIARRLRRNIVVPMAFSNIAYRDEIVRGAAHFDSRVVHVCLVAPRAVVERRLRARGASPERNAWEFRRAAECCEAHRSAVFSRHVDASERTPVQLAETILALLAAERESAA